MISLASDARASLHLEGVDASYGDGQVLHDASLAVAPGEMLSLLGPSGCGKTTLLRSIAGLHPVSAGQIEIGGRVVAGPKDWVAPEHRRVGMVFQDGALFPHLDVAANVAFGLKGQADIDDRVAEVLDLVDMADYGHRLPGTLSGGQQQRVALARALAPQPAVLLLDEPFSALDAGLRHQVRRDVKRILHEVGITVVMVTHDQDEAFVMADRVAVMQSGRIEQVGAPHELYENPSSAWVAHFVGEANVLAGEISSGSVETTLGALMLKSDAPPAGLADVLIRPEQLQLVAGSGGVVESVEYFGHDALYSVRTGEELLDVRTSLGQFVPGDDVVVKFVGSTVLAWAKDPV